jgi:predicted transcriptional regulator
VSKHLRLLREAGLLEWRAGQDRRLLFFSMPEAYRRVPGVLDFGVCTVRLP